MKKKPRFKIDERQKVYGFRDIVNQKGEVVCTCSLMYLETVLHALNKEPK